LEKNKIIQETNNHKRTNKQKTKLRQADIRHCTGFLKNQNRTSTSDQAGQASKKAKISSTENKFIRVTGIK